MTAEGGRARVAVFISGTGSNMAALLYASRHSDSPYSLALVASNDPSAPGLALARAEGVPTFALDHRGLTRAEHDRAMVAAALRQGADYIALAGYMRIMGAQVVAQWQGRMLNIHPSLLPRYKGLHTHERALEAGDQTAGCSVHLVSEELDGGAVLDQLAVAIMTDDTCETLAARVLIAEHQLYPRVLARYVSRWRDPAFLLGRVRELALALPGTCERLSHGTPGWRVGGEKSGRYFAHFHDRQNGVPHTALLVKTGSVDEMLAMIEACPDMYFKPAYYGASGWLGIVLDREDCDWQIIAERLHRSWSSVAPRTLASSMFAAG